MREPIIFICSSCGEKIPELSSEPHKMFNAAGNPCTHCAHLITKDDILGQVKEYCVHHFHKAFGRHEEHPIFHPLPHKVAHFIRDARNSFNENRF
jgi:hypothetical protein